MRYKILLLISLLLMFLEYVSFACSCRQRSLEQHYNSCEMVLKVKIIAITDTTIDDTLAGKWYNQVADSNQRNYKPPRESNYLNKAIIIGTYKGEYKLTDTVIVFSGLGYGDCGFLFEIGKEYIVFASLKRLYRMNETRPELFFDNNYLYTDICYGTEEYDSLTDKGLKILRRDNRTK